MVTKSTKKRALDETNLVPESPVVKKVKTGKTPTATENAPKAPEKTPKASKKTPKEPLKTSAVTDEAPKPATQEPSKKKKKLAESTPTVSYQPGALSNLFGKSTEGVVISESVQEGNEIVEKKTFPAKKEAETAEAKEEQKSTARQKQRDNKKKAKESAKAAVEDKEKTIFVGNMPLDMNEKVVKKIFSDYGKVDSVRLRNLIPATKKVTQRVTHLSGKLSDKQTSLIFYVKFESPEAATKALAYNGTVLNEHTIRVDKCAAKKSFDKDFSIFVGNVAFDATEQILIDFFSKEIGEVQGVRIVRDKLTGKGKGFAFISFKSEASATLALSMETIKMEKRDLRITKVMKKKQIEKVTTAKKRSAKSTTNTQKMNPDQKTKMEQFKFSTRKERSNEQNERRMLKKSAKKAIKKKKTVKKGRLMQ